MAETNETSEFLSIRKTSPITGGDRVFFLRGKLGSAQDPGGAVTTYFKAPPLKEASDEFSVSADKLVLGGRPKPYNEEDKSTEQQYYWSWDTEKTEVPTNSGYPAYTVLTTVLNQVGGTFANVKTNDIAFTNATGAITPEAGFNQVKLEKTVISLFAGGNLNDTDPIGGTATTFASLYSDNTLTVNGSLNARLETLYSNKVGDYATRETGDEEWYNGRNGFWSSEFRDHSVTKSGYTYDYKYDRIYYTGSNDLEPVESTGKGSNSGGWKPAEGAKKNSTSVSAILLSNIIGDDISVGMNMTGSLYADLSGITFQPLAGASIVGNALQVSGIIATNGSRPEPEKEEKTGTGETPVPLAAGTGTVTLGGNKNTHWKDSKIEARLQDIILGGDKRYEKFKNAGIATDRVHVTYDSNFAAEGVLINTSSSTPAPYNPLTLTNAAWNKKFQVKDEKSGETMTYVLSSTTDYILDKELPAQLDKQAQNRSSEISYNKLESTGIKADEIVLGSVDSTAEIVSEVSGIKLHAETISVSGDILESDAKISGKATFSSNQVTATGMTANNMTVNGNYFGRINAKVDDLSATKQKFVWNYEMSDELLALEEGKTAEQQRALLDNTYNEEKGYYQILIAAKDEKEKGKERNAVVERTITIEDLTDVMGDYIVSNYGIKVDDSLSITGAFQADIQVDTGDITQFASNSGTATETKSKVFSANTKSYGIYVENDITLTQIFAANITVNTYTASYYDSVVSQESAGLRVTKLTADALGGTIIVRNIYEYEQGSGGKWNASTGISYGIDIGSFSNLNSTLSTPKNDGQFDFICSISTGYEESKEDNLKYDARLYSLDWGIKRSTEGSAADLNMRLAGTIQNVKLGFGDSKKDLFHDDVVEIAAGAVLDATQYKWDKDAKKVVEDTENTGISMSFLGGSDNLYLDSNATVKGDLRFDYGGLQIKFMLNEQTFDDSSKKTTSDTDAILQGRIINNDSEKKSMLCATTLGLSVVTNGAKIDNLYKLVSSSDAGDIMSSSKTITIFDQTVTSADQDLLTVYYGHMNDSGVFEKVSTGVVTLNKEYFSTTLQFEDESKKDARSAIQIWKGGKVVYQAHLEGNNEETEQYFGVKVDVRDSTGSAVYKDLQNLEQKYDGANQTMKLSWMDNSKNRNGIYQVEYRIVTYADKSKQVVTDITKTIVRNVVVSSQGPDKEIKVETETTYSPDTSILLENIADNQDVQWRVRQSTSLFGEGQGEWMTTQTCKDGVKDKSGKQIVDGVDATVTTTIPDTDSQILNIRAEKFDAVTGLTVVNEEYSYLRWDNIKTPDVSYQLTYWTLDKEGKKIEGTEGYLLVDPTSDQYQKVLISALKKYDKTKGNLHWEVYAYQRNGDPDVTSKWADSSESVSKVSSAVVSYNDETKAYTLESPVIPTEKATNKTTLSWNRISDVTSYRLEYCFEDADGKLTSKSFLVEDKDSKSEFVSYELPEDQYKAAESFLYYRVRAENVSQTVCGNWSVYHLTDIVSMSEDLTQLKKDGIIALKWTTNQIGSDYRLEYQIVTKNGDKTETVSMPIAVSISNSDPANTDKKDLTYKIGNLKENQYVQWRVAIEDDSYDWFTPTGEEQEKYAISGDLNFVEKVKNLTVKFDFSDASHIYTFDWDAGENVTVGTYTYRVEYFQATKKLAEDEIRAAFEDEKERKNYQIVTADVTDTELTVSGSSTGEYVYYRVQTLDNDYDYANDKNPDNVHASDWVVGAPVQLDKSSVPPSFNKDPESKRVWYSKLTEDQKKDYPEDGAVLTEDDSLMEGIISWDSTTVQKSETDLREYIFKYKLDKEVAVQTAEVRFYYRTIKNKGQETEESSGWSEVVYDADNGIKIPHTDPGTGKTLTYEIRVLNLANSDYSWTLEAVDYHNNSVTYDSDIQNQNWLADVIAPDTPQDGIKMDYDTTTVDEKIYAVPSFSWKTPDDDAVYGDKDGTGVAKYELSWTKGENNPTYSATIEVDPLLPVGTEVGYTFNPAVNVTERLDNKNYRWTLKAYDGAGNVSVAGSGTILEEDAAPEFTLKQDVKTPEIPVKVEPLVGSYASVTINWAEIYDCKDYWTTTDEGKKADDRYKGSGVAYYTLSYGKTGDDKSKWKKVNFEKTDPDTSFVIQVPNADYEFEISATDKFANTSSAISGTWKLAEGEPQKPANVTISTPILNKDRETNKLEWKDKNPTANQYVISYRDLENDSQDAQVSNIFLIGFDGTNLSQWDKLNIQKGTTENTWTYQKNDGTGPIYTLTYKSGNYTIEVCNRIAEEADDDVVTFSYDKTKKGYTYTANVKDIPAYQWNIENLTSYDKNGKVIQPNNTTWSWEGDTRAPEFLKQNNPYTSDYTFTYEKETNTVAYTRTLTVSVTSENLVDYFTDGTMEPGCGVKSLNLYYWVSGEKQNVTTVVKSIDDKTPEGTVVFTVKGLDVTRTYDWIVTAVDYCGNETAYTIGGTSEENAKCLSGRWNKDSEAPVVQNGDDKLFSVQSYVTTGVSAKLATTLAWKYEVVDGKENRAYSYDYYSSSSQLNGSGIKYFHVRYRLKGQEKWIKEFKIDGKAVATGKTTGGTIAGPSSDTTITWHYDAETHQYTVDFSLPNKQTDDYEWQVYGEDFAGNIATGDGIQTDVWKCDRMAPTFDEDYVESISKANAENKTTGMDVSVKWSNVQDYRNAAEDPLKEGTGLDHFVFVFNNDTTQEEILTDTKDFSINDVTFHYTNSGDGSYSITANNLNGKVKNGYTWTIKAVDKAGNESTQDNWISGLWTVDRVEPRFVVIAGDEYSFKDETDFTTDAAGNCYLSFSVNWLKECEKDDWQEVGDGNGSGIKTYYFQYRIKGDKSWITLDNKYITETDTTWTATVDDKLLSRLDYEWRVYAEDWYGNRMDPDNGECESGTIYGDRLAPKIESIDPDSPKWYPPDEEKKTWSGTCTVNLTAVDKREVADKKEAKGSGVSYFMYRTREKGSGESEWSDWKKAEAEVKDPESENPVAKASFQVKIEDVTKSYDYEVYAVDNAKNGSAANAVSGTIDGDMLCPTIISVTSDPNPTFPGDANTLTSEIIWTATDSWMVDGDGKGIGIDYYTLTVTQKFSDKDTYKETITIAAVNGSQGSAPKGIGYWEIDNDGQVTFTITGEAGSDFEWSLTATDYAGNAIEEKNAKTGSVTGDHVGPDVLNAESSAIDIKDEKLTSTISFEAYDVWKSGRQYADIPGSGVETVSIQITEKTADGKTIDHGTETVKGWTVKDNKVTGSYEVTGAANSNFTWTLSFEDYAGNTATATDTIYGKGKETDPIQITKKPENPQFYPEYATGETGKAYITVGWKPKEAGSQYSYVLSWTETFKDGTSQTHEQPFTLSPGEQTFTIDGAANSDFSWTLKATDIAGNETEVAKDQKVSGDHLGPVFDSITSSDKPVFNDDKTLSSEITWTARDVLKNGTAYAGLDGSGIQKYTLVLTETTKDGKTSEQTITLPSTQSSYTVTGAATSSYSWTLKAVDYAENVSQTTETGTITGDKVAPEAVNNYTVEDPVFSKTKMSVKAAWEATTDGWKSRDDEAGSGVAYYTFYYRKAGSQDLYRSKKIDVTDLTKKTYSVTIKDLDSSKDYEWSLTATDKAGNESDKKEVTGTVYGDHKAPTIKINKSVTNYPEFSSNGTLSFTVSGTVSDLWNDSSDKAGTGVKSVSMSYGEKGSAQEDWITVDCDYDEAAGTWFVEVLDKENKDYEWHINAVDYAGNTTTGTETKSGEILGDIAKPIIQNEPIVTFEYNTNGTFNFILNVDVDADDWRTAGDGLGSGIKEYVVRYKPTGAPDSWFVENTYLVKGSQMALKVSNLNGGILDSYDWELYAVDSVGLKSDKAVTGTVTNDIQTPRFESVSPYDMSIPEPGQWITTGIAAGDVARMSFTVIGKLVDDWQEKEDGKGSGVTGYTWYYRIKDDYAQWQLGGSSTSSDVYFTVDGSSPAFYDGLKANQDYEWKIVTTDKAGNDTEFIYTIYGDSVAPTMSTEHFSKEIKYNEKTGLFDIEIRMFAAKDLWHDGSLYDGSGVRYYTFRYKDAKDPKADWQTKTYDTLDESYLVIRESLPSSEYQWELTATDWAGNTSAKLEGTLAADVTKPEITITKPAETGETDTPVWSKDGKTMTYTVSGYIKDVKEESSTDVTSTPTGIKSYTYRWKEDSVTVTQWNETTVEVDALETEFSFDITGDSTKNYVWEITAVDKVGNESELKTDKVYGDVLGPKVDTVPQEVPTFTQDKMSFTVKGVMSDDWRVEGDGKGVGAVSYTWSYRVNNEFAPWSTAVTVASTKDIEFTIDNMDAGTDYVWQLVATDKVGNTTTITGDILGDIAAPEIDETSITASLTQVGTTGKYTMTIQSFAAKDGWRTQNDNLGSGVRSYTLNYKDLNTGKSQSVTIEAPEDPTEPIEITVKNLACHNYEWTLTATDWAGNETTTAAQTLTGDNTPPVFESDFNAMEYTYIQDVSGTFISVVDFAWNRAEDPIVEGETTTGFAKYVLSYAAAGSDNYKEITTITNQNITAYSWDESKVKLSDGTYTWKVTAYDKAGNGTDLVGTDSFTVDRTAPEGTFDLVKGSEEPVIVETEIKDYYEHPVTVYYEVPTQAVFKMASEKFTDVSEPVSYEVVIYGQDSSTQMMTDIHTFTVTDKDLEKGYTVDEEEGETAAVFLKLDSTNGKGVGAIMGMPSNMVYWKVCAIDAYGNKSSYVYGQPFKASYKDHDYQKPTQVSITEVESSTENKTMTINWSSSYAAYGVEYYVVTVKRAVTGDELGSYTVDAAVGNETLTLPTGQVGTYGIVDGYLQITVQAFDYNGHSSANSKAYDFLLDTVNPTFTATPAQVTSAGRMVQLDWDDMKDNIAPGWYEYVIVNEKTSQIVGSGTTETSDLLWKATYNGAYSYYIRAYDLVGNVADTVKSGSFSVLDDIPFTYGDNANHAWGETLTRAVGSDVTSDLGYICVDNASQVTILIDNVKKQDTSSVKAGVKITIKDSNGKQIKAFSVKQDKAAAYTFYWNEAAQAGTQYYIQIAPQSKYVITTCDFTATCDAYTQGNKEDDNWASLDTSVYNSEIQCDASGKVLSLYDNATQGAEEWVGFGDATDYRLLEFNDAGNYTFALNNLSGNGAPATLTIYKKNGSSLSKVTAVTLKKNASSVSTKSLLLDDSNTYYYSVTMKSTNKGNNAYYKVSASGNAFVDGNNIDDTKELADLNDCVAKITMDGGKLKLIDTVTSGEEWVGYGDLTDYRQLDLGGCSGNYQFTLTRTDELNPVKLTIWEEVNGKMKSLAKVTANKGSSVTTKALELDEDGVYYYSVEATKGKSGKGAHYEMSISGTPYGELESGIDLLGFEASEVATPILASSEPDVLAGIEDLSSEWSSYLGTSSSSLDEDKDKSSLGALLASC